MTEDEYSIDIDFNSPNLSRISMKNKNYKIINYTIVGFLIINIVMACITITLISSNINEIKDTDISIVDYIGLIFFRIGQIFLFIYYLITMLFLSYDFYRNRHIYNKIYQNKTSYDPKKIYFDKDAINSTKNILYVLFNLLLLLYFVCEVLDADKFRSELIIIFIMLIIALALIIFEVIISIYYKKLYPDRHL